ncbi:MAG: hypothetical protein IPH29_14315 [Candidatus Microthrix sp.]|uniref:Trypsin-co-occurring domain-containing protein n=1 Tax=Candidatus Neomicrothrix subdominans TaxID=2954438 RepID=A0A936NBN0_9ACTN|nr:hypothetical protein [Candidatus Microthrix sp.]MBK9297335.1 hypothetical protein [Candidatus Microthrix subdominans]
MSVLEGSTTVQTRLVPFVIGDVEVQVQVEVVGPSGSRQVSATGGVAERSVAAFERVEDVIAAVAERVAGLVAGQARSGLAPDELTVAFGVSFSIEGGLVFAKGSAGSTIEVTLTYKNDISEPGGTS